MGFRFRYYGEVFEPPQLLQDMAACLKPGGRLLLTTPYLLYHPITRADAGPFSKTEDGWHVRRGYTEAMLSELCDHAGLVPERFSYCSGFLSQKITTLMRVGARIHPALGWALVLPLRPLPPLLDGMISALTGWPSYSICLEAYKPRFS